MRLRTDLFRRIERLEQGARCGVCRHWGVVAYEFSVVDEQGNRVVTQPLRPTTCPGCGRTAAFRSIRRIVFEHVTPDVEPDDAAPATGSPPTRGSSTPVTNDDDWEGTW